MTIYSSLIGIAGREQRRGPMIEVQSAHVSRAAGLSGDCKGVKHSTRQITVLASEDWQVAMKALSSGRDESSLALSWTTRRANLLVEGLRLPRVKGAVLQIGVVQLEVTGQTYPCRRMEEACRGLLKALAVEWRGGVTCRVLTEGDIKVGDRALVLSSPPEPPPRRLPG